jgi:hypothetical protein
VNFVNTYLRRVRLRNNFAFVFFTTLQGSSYEQLQGDNGDYHNNDCENDYNNAANEESSTSKKLHGDCNGIVDDVSGNDEQNDDTGIVLEKDETVTHSETQSHQGTTQLNDDTLHARVSGSLRPKLKRLDQAKRFKPKKGTGKEATKSVGTNHIDNVAEKQPKQAEKPFEANLLLLTKSPALSTPQEILAKKTAFSALDEFLVPYHAMGTSQQENWVLRAFDNVNPEFSSTCLKKVVKEVRKG